MFQQFLDQAGTMFKPLHDLVSLNQSAFEALTNKQTALVSDIVNESIAFTQKVLAEKDGNYWDLHKTYWEGLNQKLNQASQEATEYFSATQTKLSDMMQESLLGGAMVEVTKHMPSVEAAVAAAMKPMDTAKIKPAEATKVPAVKPVPVAAKAKPAEKPVEKAAAAKSPKKPAVKAVTPKNAQAKSSSTTKPVTEASVKGAAKPSASKGAAPMEASKRVGGDDATVESVIRSIMSERNKS